MNNIIINNNSNEKVVAEKRAPRLKKTILTSALSLGIMLGSMENGFCMKQSKIKGNKNNKHTQNIINLTQEQFNDLCSKKEYQNKASKLEGEIKELIKQSSQSAHIINESQSIHICNITSELKDQGIKNLSQGVDLKALLSLDIKGPSRLFIMSVNSLLGTQHEQYNQLEGMDLPFFLDVLRRQCEGMMSAGSAIQKEAEKYILKAIRNCAAIGNNNFGINKYYMLSNCDMSIAKTYGVEGDDYRNNLTISEKEVRSMIEERESQASDGIKNYVDNSKKATFSYKIQESYLKKIQGNHNINKEITDNENALLDISPSSIQYLLNKSIQKRLEIYEHNLNLLQLYKNSIREIQEESEHYFQWIENDLKQIPNKISSKSYEIKLCKQELICLQKKN